MSAITKQIAAVEFQVNARQANQAIDSMKQKADECNKKVEDLQERLKQGIQTITIKGKPTDVEKEIRNQQRLARSYNDAAAALMKGVKAWDELWKHAKMGNIEDLTGQQIKAGVNGAKRQYDRLILGDEEDRRKAAAIRDIIDQADIVLAKLKGDTDKVIQTLSDGGHVADEVLQREKKNLEDMLSLTEKFSPEWQDYNRQLQAITKGIEEQTAQEKRLRGELVDANDARREAAKLDKDVAQAAKEQHAAQQQIIDDAQKQMQQYQEQRRQHQETAQKITDEIEKQDRQIASQSQLVESIKRENYERTKKSNVLVQEADQADKTAAKAQRAADRSAKEVEKFSDKLQKAKDDVAALSEQLDKSSDNDKQAVVVKLTKALDKQSKAEETLKQKEKEAADAQEMYNRANADAVAKHEALDKAKAEGNKKLQEESQKLSQLQGTREASVASLNQEKEAIKQKNEAVDAQAKIINDAQQTQAKSRQLSIESIEKSIALLKQENRVIGDETNPQWVENENTIGRLNQRLSEMKQHAAELRGEAMSVSQAMDISNIVSGQRVRDVEPADSRVERATAKTRETLANVEGEIGRVNSDMEKLNAEMDKIGNRSTNLNPFVESLQKTNTLLHEQEEQRRVTADGFAKEAEQRQKAIAAQKEQVELLKSEKQSAVTGIDQRIQAMQARMAELQGYEIKPKDYKQVVASIQDEIKKLEEEKAAIENSAETKQRFADANRKLAQLIKEDSEATASEKTALGKLDEQIANTQSEMKKLADSVPGFDLDDIQHYAAELSKLNEYLSKLKQERSSLSRIYTTEQAEREKAIQAQRDEIALMRRQKEEAISSINARIEAGRKMLETLNALPSEERKNGPAKGMLDSTHQTIRELYAQRDSIIKESDAKIEQATSKYTSLMKANEEATAKAEATLRKYNEDIYATQQQISEFAQKLSSVKGPVDAKEFEESSKQMDELKNKLASLTAERQKYTDQLQRETEEATRLAEAEKTAAEAEQNSVSIEQMEKAISVLQQAQRTTTNNVNAARYANAIDNLTQKLKEAKGEAVSLKEALEMADANSNQPYSIEEMQKGLKTLQGQQNTAIDPSQYTEAISVLTQKIREAKGEAVSLEEAMEMANVNSSQPYSIEEMQKGLKALQEQQNTAIDPSKYTEAISVLTQKIREAKGEAVSLEDALNFGKQGLAGSFKGTTEQLRQAKQVLESTLATTAKGSDRYKEIREALAGIAVEEKRVGEVSKEVQKILDQPKGHSFNELKVAVEQGRKELNSMTRTTKEGQKAYDKLAKKVKAADLEMKNLGNDSKGTQSSFEKAWSRLKTYVTLYMGTAVALQKASDTIDDLMELSDKMGEVRKTTGFSADEVGRLSDNLERLDTRTPITELMDLSATAGQLGLKTQEDIQGFTEAANEMLVALPEMGQDGATQMMKIAIATGEVDKIRKQMENGTIEGSSATAVAMEKIGSTIDRLRATTAAAAPPIADFVKRVGAVGAQSGITVDQVAALGATVDSLGMGTEMAGTAIARMIPAIKNNAFDIAKALGITPDSLRQLFATGKGMEAVLMVLEKMRDNGMDAKSIESFLGENGMSGLMKDLNQKGARAGIVFAGLSQNVDLLRQNLNTANQAYQDGTAIQQEYNKMNDTTAAKWERLKNTVEEFFVNNANQSFLGEVLDKLRAIADFITGSGELSVGVRGLILLIAVFRMNVAGILKGALAVFPQIVNGIKLIGVQLGIVKMEAAAADATMKKMQWTNIFMAVAAAALYVAYSFSNMKSATQEASEELGKVRLQIDQAEERFEDYWKQIDRTNASVRKSQNEHNRLDAEVKRLTASTDKGSRATAVLSSKERELRDSENKVTRASNEHRIAIANMNAIYGKYLGYLLTERNRALLAADAHEQIAKAIEKEMLMKQQEAAITSISSKNQEKITQNYGDLVKEIGSYNISEKAAAQLVKDFQNFMRQNIHYDPRTGGYNVYPWVYEYLGIKNGTKISANEIAYRYAVKHMETNFHYNQVVAKDIASKFANNLADSYLNNMREVGITKQMFQNDINQDNTAITKSKNLQFLKNRIIALNAVNTLKSGRLSKAQESQYYEDLGNALLGMQKTQTGKWSNGQVRELLNTMKHTKGIDYNRVIATKDNIAQRISQQQNSDVENPEASEIHTTTPSGHTSTYTPPHYDAGETQPNPWGGSISATSTNWSEMSADVLVDRRKQMNKFVRALQEDSDVSQVLSEDPALQRAISKKQVANNADAVIDWYNQQRLAIQKELHKKHLTNTGGWMDPKKKKTKKGRQKSPRKIVNDEISYYLDSLDAYYTDRKAAIEEMQSNGDISEAEGWRRNLQNQQQWQLRRGELQQLYSKKRGGVSQSERNAIYSIIGDRTGETSDMVEGNIQSTISFIRAVGTKSLAEMRAIYGDLDLGMEKSFQRMQKAVADQMSAIKDIVDKERPFNGIIDNLETNITKMGLLQKDFENKRIALERQGVDQDDKRLTDIVRQQREDLPKRLNFLLGEAEHAYEITWDKLADDMEKNGYGSWLDAILNSEDPAEAKRAMMAQLHAVYDDVQDAVKKEADLVKKQVENIWNDSTLLPSKVSIKNTFQRAIDALGVEENGVNRANQLISAGVRSERVADRLAIKQLQIQLDMQTHYYNLVRQTGLQHIEYLQRAAKEKEKIGKIEEAERLNMDARHAQMSLDLSMSEKETNLAKLRADLQDKTDESQSRLYKHLQEWSTLLSSSMQGLFEASNTGAADYYNNLAKMRLTGEGSAGGTYVIIDNAGTKDATAHYENLDGEEALKRQLEIEQQNAVADEWKKVMDDINKKINDEITDWMNAQLQNQAIDNNTKALVENTKALWEIIHGKYTNDVTDGKFSRNANGLAVDQSGNVIYPIEPADTGSKKKGGVPSWNDMRGETETNARNQWAAYSNLAPTKDENGIYRNGEGMAVNDGGEIIYPLQPTEAAEDQTPAQMFWPSDSDYAEGYATTLWTAYRDASIQAQTDIAEANAELQSEGGSLAPTLPATEEQTQQMVENIQTVNQAYADSTIQAQQDIADAKAEAGTGGGDDGLVHADGTRFGTESDPLDLGGVTITTPHRAAADASTAATEKIVENNKKIETSTKQTNKTQEDSTKSTYAAMAQAMNMYGLAYQVMSNDNMSSTQKFLTFALQSAGQVAIAMLTTNMLQTEGESKVELPGIFGKAVKQLGPVAGPIAFAAMTALLGGLMAVATSKVSKSKSQIAQVTGASVSAGRLSTGMLTYATGNVNEFTDPSSLTPGQQYNVDAADGHTYRARYMGANPKTHLTNGPEFHLVGERGREAIIDANTTRQLQMNDTGIWQAIQTLYNGGSIRSVRRGGMRNFANGNIDDFADVSSAGMAEAGGSTPETSDVVSSLQASLDRNSDVLERAMRDGIKGVFDIHGKGGLVDSYDRGKKEAKRHGEKY